MGKTMNYKHTVILLSLLYTPSNCLSHISLLQRGRKTREESLVKFHINTKYFTERRSLAITTTTRNALQTSKYKRKHSTFPGIKSICFHWLLSAKQFTLIYHGV